MPDIPVDKPESRRGGADDLLARAVAAEARAQHDLTVAVNDFFLPAEARLNERSRAGLASLLRTLVASVETEIRSHCGGLPGAEEDARSGEQCDARGVFERLNDAGLLRNDALMEELLGRVRQEALGAALPMQAHEDPKRPSLINRFVQHSDPPVAEAAMAVLVAESRRRARPDPRQPTRSDLPAELHYRLVWWVAAALRVQAAEAEDTEAAPLDSMLSEAARRSLAQYDESERLEEAAMRLASAIAAPPGALGHLLAEALGDRRIVLFIALLGDALTVDYAQARALVLDPAGDRLWLALRALELGRESIAQIGYALCEADPRRDLDGFADALDMIVGIDAEDAREALLPLRLNPEYRAAAQAIERSRGER